MAGWFGGGDVGGGFVGCGLAKWEDGREGGIVHMAPGLRLLYFSSFLERVCWRREGIGDVGKGGGMWAWGMIVQFCYFYLF